MESQVSQMLNKDILVTTDGWFIGHDGQQYRAVYGKLIAIHTDEQALGVKTNARSTNWYAQVGGMLIAGCQIHYAINCEGKHINFDKCAHEGIHEGEIVNTEHTSKIYNANFETEKL
tara:strand:- start:224 stop:574 length:351 start_codon:yes stop_codon:yes gene_type:complete